MEKLTKDEMVKLFGDGYDTASMKFEVGENQSRDDAVKELNIIMDFLTTNFFEKSC